VNISTYLITILFTFVPIFELRGSLPYAYFQGIPIIQAYLLTVASNALVSPLLLFFLRYMHRLFWNWSFYRRVFTSSVERARMRLEPKIRKYGYLGVMLFIAVPLPITGAYTGTLGAWILGLDTKRIILAAAGGVIISGLIVSALLLAGTQTHSIFIRIID